MQLKNALNFNTLRFGIAYALGLFVAGVDLSISVRAGENLTGSSLGGTAAYVLIALGTIIAARVGAPRLQTIGPKRTYFGAGIICVLSGIATSYAAYAHIAPLFYMGMFLVGIFMGLSNFHRLLVKDYSENANLWDTSLVLLSGVAGSILGPWAAGTIAPSIGEFHKAYQLVVVIGVLTLITSLMLPTHSKIRGKESSNPSAYDDRSALYLGGVAGMLGYVVMTLMMTAVPLEAQKQSLSSHEIAQLTEMHMVTMYLPIIMVPPLLAKYSSRNIEAWALCLGGFGALCVMVGDPHIGRTSLAVLMVIAGSLWAFSYTAASNTVAANHFGQANPSARGYVEMLPPIGMVLGAILAGVLLEHAGFVYVVLAFVFISIMAVPILVFMGKTKSEAARR